MARPETLTRIEQQSPRDLTAALRRCAEPLPPPEDFDAFGAYFDRFGDATIVLLGEATHGSSEFYRARAAITRRLIEWHGFNIVAVEADIYPRPVIVRMSDFKTNEYRSLIGGADFEDEEANPMIGFRGAARYVDDRYAPAFALECAAILDVRDRIGLDNVIVMIPFCRRVAEARAVIAALARNGLVRGQNGLKVYAMAEIPSNALSIDAFAAEFDGFSIGSNDLTQLTLGIDRDSALLAEGFDEQDPAVLKLIEQIIAGAHRHGLPCGLCGQGPSDKPAFADWLAAQGIDSVSLNPDSVSAYIARLASASSQRRDEGEGSMTTSDRTLKSRAA